MRIAEIFESVQGEGQFAGTPSAFVRTTGCNLRCWFCDTRYTSWEPEGKQRTWQSVFEQVCEIPCEHVVVTGGEPLLQPDVVPLTLALGNAGKFVTIETAATVYRPVHADLMSISPKLASAAPATKSARAVAERRILGISRPFSRYTPAIRSLTAWMNPVPVSISVPKRTI